MTDGEGSARQVAQFLKSNDRDRYYATLVVRPECRDAIQALYAFSADVAAVRERAREPAAGEIRLQWWTDALRGEGHGNVRQNPIAEALLDAIERYRLPAEALLRLVAARRFDLYDDPMPDVASFEGYAGETASVLYQLAAMILNDGHEIGTGDAAGHLGVAHALIGHLRAFGLNASKGRLFLPLSVFASNGVTEGEVLSGTMSEGLAAAHAQLGEQAQDHLDRAGAAISELPVSLRPAFCMLALLRRQLAQFEARPDDPFAPARDISDWQKIAMLAWWTLRQR